MTPTTPKNLAASVRARLLERSRQTGEDHQFLLQRYAAERFLYRLGESEHREDFILKGATLLALWRGGTYRPTRDLDFTAYGNSWEEQVRSKLQKICSISAEDGIVFDKEEIKLESIRDHAAYNSFRGKIRAAMGKTRISLQLDIGFGNAIQPSPVDSEYATILDHPAPRIRVYPREAFVAEKLHAMVFLGERNSRYKDFYDLYTLADHFAFDGKSLRDAIVATFELRNTTISEAQPVALTPQFYADTDRARAWSNYLELSGLVGAPSEFEVVGERLSEFLTGMWRAIANEFDFIGKWPEGGPWSKNSGIKWLGEIPLHWEVKQLKRVFSVRNGSTPRSAEPLYWDGDVTWVTPEDLGRLEQSVISSSKRCITDVGLSSCGTSLIPASSIVLSTRAPIGHIAIAGIDLCTNQGCRGLIPRGNTSARYYYYLLLAARSDLQSLGQGSTYMELSREHLGSMYVVVPDSPEQRAIAGYLDRETGKIDALVTKKERLIELLKEKRAALITQAVTKGLDPDAPMTDSGIPWLGEIPAHWSVNRLKTISNVQLSNVDKKSVSGQMDVQLCNYVDVYYNERIEADRNFMVATASREQIQRFSLFEGDVLITKDSEAWTDIAVPAVVKEDLPNVLCGYHLAHIRPLQNCSGPYLAYAFAAEGPGYQYQLAANGITRFGLGGDAIRCGVFPWPPLSEQRTIAGFLDQETARIDSLVARVRDAIERFKELRSALISAAVTGKIDVRDAVA